MRYKNHPPLLPYLAALVLISLACGNAQPTPVPTATLTVIPTNTTRPSPTPRPTRTPNLEATQRADDLNATAQSYFEKGYLTTASGTFTELDDFEEEWAQLGWYNWWIFDDKASDFFLSGHFKWTSAYKNADSSGCGFVFGIQDNNDHYAVFLDRTKIIYINADQSSGYARPIGTTRGTGQVSFGEDTEADFTLIVTGVYSYVLVDGEVVGEYTLAQSRPVYGNIGLTLLSGTNKDYGTRCKMTDLHLWVPEG